MPMSALIRSADIAGRARYFGITAHVCIAEGSPESTHPAKAKVKVNSDQRHPGDRKPTIPHVILLTFPVDEKIAILGPGHRVPGEKGHASLRIACGPCDSVFKCPRHRGARRHSPRAGAR